MKKYNLKEKENGVKIEAWKLKIANSRKELSADTEIDARVPGDITADLYRAGIISDPYFGLNHKSLGWIAEEDFIYTARFDVASEVLSGEEVVLTFLGIDLFSEIYLNGTLIGKTENAFLPYRYEVKKLLRENNNELAVKMFSTTKRLNAVDCKDYFGVFNLPRMFLRKPQCHFGWDWAPDMPAYGIFGKVTLEGVSENRIETTNYKTANDGSVILIAELNYTVRPQVDFFGKVVKTPKEEWKNDEIRYSLATIPNTPLESANPVVKIGKVTDRVNFKNFKIDAPKLWYPAGEGEQPLYAYKTELMRNGKVIGEKRGRLAFREVKLEEKPCGDDAVGFKFVINGKYVFAKGSNWVPIDCFTGTIAREKYDRLLSLAKDGNLNMLRVWGGGFYESDDFYDLCDEKGIMVWQDFMFACSDIPEEEEFVSAFEKEAEYQIKRLRVHPSIVYWCGGNEKTGSFGVQASHGDRVVNVILRGLVDALDGTRPYEKQSPYSINDVANDFSSGDTHAGFVEPCLLKDALSYRKGVANNPVSFMSECAEMGPTSLQSFKKFLPEDKFWDMNEYWQDRLMDNPWSAVDMDFCDRQKFYVEGLYGKCDKIEEFIAKGMTVHAELLRAEIEFARYNKARCGGMMNWMYSEIWPSATWAIVDYYTEPKQAYYQARRSYKPVYASFTEDKDGTRVFLVNDTDKAVSAKIRYGMKTSDGEIIWEKKAKITAAANKVWSEKLTEADRGENRYLFVTAETEKEKISTVYSADMWHGCRFKSDYTYKTEAFDGGIRVTVKAKSFAKGVTFILPDNYKYDYSDNYVDIEAGEEKTVCIGGAGKELIPELVVTDFNKETKK